MDTHARPLEVDDGPAIAAIDRAYARAHRLEPGVTSASLRFFARSGHAFVAVGAATVRGFVLAQPVFDGERATVFAARLASRPPGDGEALRALLQALTKSAYDAGVYDLRVELPAGDGAGAAALTAAAYAVLPRTLYARHLGSRAAAVAAASGRPREDGEHG